LAGYLFTPTYPSLIAEASMLSLSSSLPSDTAALAEIGLSGHISEQIKEYSAGYRLHGARELT